MDLVTYIEHTKKGLKYLEDLSSSNSRLYSKSKVRLKELAEICSKMVELTAEILKDEVLDDDVDEFGGSSSVLLDAANTIQTTVDELKEFTDMSRDNGPKISSAKNKMVFATYCKTLKSTASCDNPYVEAHDLAKLLWKWFDVRFVTSMNVRTAFHYNIRRMPTWIYDIIILYGYHLRNRTLPKFIESFNQWCDNLYTSSAGEQYAVPYEVFLVDRNPVEYLSMEAVVLSDILFEHGLSYLNHSDPLYLSDSYLYELVSKYNSPLLDRYNDYEYDKNLLELCGIHGGDN